MKALFPLSLLLLATVVATAAPAEPTAPAKPSTAPTATAAPAKPTPPANPFVGPAVSAPQNRIDELVFGQLKTLGIEPAQLCSDAVFVRRAFLDIIGTVPTAEEVKTFLADKDPAKRNKLIDRLLERPEFADYWALRWSDLLRVKAEFPINLWPNGAQAYHRWIYAAVKDNLPYDQFARQLLTSNGSNFRVAPVNFYRALQNKTPTGIAQTVALTFMGTRADKWPAEKMAGMAAFFSQIGFKYTAEWKEEIVFYDATKAVAGAPAAVFPDGTVANLPCDRDPREVFADWLLRPDNPWFARAIANRVWSWLLGRGIVDEADDLRPDNPPSNPALLAYLEQEVVQGHYDLKRLFRLILNSSTYQLSSIPRSDKPEAAAHFASYPLRRLEAEVLIDALNQITGTTERYSSAIPEPYTFIPDDQRSIALPDGSISSAFLELFGRPPRDTGLESERNNKLTALQSLHLLNSSHIRRKIEQGPKMAAIFRGRPGSGEIVNGLYLTILSRYPTAEELKVLAARVQANPKAGREGAIDVAWALLNTDEFLFRH